MLSSVTDHKKNNIYHFPSSRKCTELQNRIGEAELAAIGFVKKIGIRPNLLGYKLLISAIVEVLEKDVMFTPLSKNVYPAIAEKYGVTVEAVERNIRRAIDSAYTYDPDRLTSVFYYKTGKPYVTEVISMAVETIRFEAVTGSYPAAAQ